MAGRLDIETESPFSVARLASGWKNPLPAAERALAPKVAQPANLCKKAARRSGFALAAEFATLPGGALTARLDANALRPPTA